MKPRSDTNWTGRSLTLPLSIPRIPDSGYPRLVRGIVIAVASCVPGYLTQLYLECNGTRSELVLIFNSSSTPPLQCSSADWISGPYFGGRGHLNFNST